MKFDRLWYFDTEKELSSVVVNEVVDENRVDSIKKFYTYLYLKFRDYLIEERKQEGEKNEGKN